MNSPFTDYSFVNYINLETWFQTKRKCPFICTHLKVTLKSIKLNIFKKILVVQ